MSRVEPAVDVRLSAAERRGACMQKDWMDRAHNRAPRICLDKTFTLDEIEAWLRGWSFRYTDPALYVRDPKHGLAASVRGGEG